MSTSSESEHGGDPDTPVHPVTQAAEPAQATPRKSTDFRVVVPSSGLPAFASVARRTHPASPAQPATASAADSPPLTAPTKRSRARLWVAVLAITTLTVAGLAAYLWVINGQWENQNDALRADVAGLSVRVDDTQAQIVDLEAQLDDAQANLDGATGKVTDLADTSANAQDQAAFLTELADSFQQCADAQASHISHLQNASRYTASSLAAEGRDVETYCDGVEEAHAEFLTSLETG